MDLDRAWRNYDSSTLAGTVELGRKRREWRTGKAGEPQGKYFEKKEITFPYPK